MKKIIVGLMVILVIGAGSYYYKNNSKTQESSSKYEVFKVNKSTFKKVVEVDGVVKAMDTKLVYADRPLKVDEVFYSAGDYVKKGEVIMTFDPEDKNTVTRNLKKEKITLKKLERDLKNSKSLFEVGGSSQVEIENIEFEIEKSRLNIEGLEEELAKMLDKIKSPFNGTIISMIAEANYRVNTEVELFEVADLSNLIVVADVPEYSIQGVKLGQEVIIKPDAYDDKFHGIVTKISTLSSATASTSSSNSSSTTTNTEAYVEVEITIENLPKELRPGFNASVDIVTTSIPNAITIPRSSVLEDEKGYYVFVLNDENEIRKNYIKIKDSNKNSIIVNNLRDNISILKNPNIALNGDEQIQVGGNGEGSGNGQGQGRGQGKGQGGS